MCAREVGLFVPQRRCGLYGGRDAGNGSVRCRCANLGCGSEFGEGVNGEVERGDVGQHGRWERGNVLLVRDVSEDG